MAVYKIGRGDGNQIVLAEKSISRQHAELEELGAGRFRLKDLGSSSGTQVLSGADWIEVTETEIRHDTRIRFGEYETSPMELLRDQDMTQVQARPAPPAAAPPQVAKAPPPVPKAPPAKAPPPKAAPPAAKAPPRPPAPPRPVAAPAAAGAAPANNKKMLLLLGGGLGAFLLLAIIVVVVVLATGGDDTRRADAPPARTEAPATPPATPPARPPVTPPATPPAQPPATPPAQPNQGTQGAQRFAQICSTTWKGSAAACQCLAGALRASLQDGDYGDFIDLMSMIIAQKAEDARKKLEEIAQTRQDAATRLRTAFQKLNADCKEHLQ